MNQIDTYVRNTDTGYTEVVHFRTGRSMMNVWEEDLPVTGVEWSGQTRVSKSDP